MVLTTGFERAVVAAARACLPWIGKGDKVAADQVAVEAMRGVLNALPMNGRIVIGEGERDEAPMLHIGEELGCGGPEIDIAVDPLEGTSLCAENQPGAMCVLSYAPRGQILHAPDIYMDKIAVGPGLRLESADMDRPLTDILTRIGEQRGRPARVVMLNRERHRPQMESVQNSGAFLSLISDGDVMACLQTAIKFSSKVPDFDLCVGTGGAPEGVLAASGLQHLGGTFFGRLNATSAAEKQRADNHSISDLSRIYSMGDLASKESTLIMAGVTDYVLKGVSQTGVDLMSISNSGVRRKTL